VFVIPRSLIKNIVMPTRIDKNEVPVFTNTDYFNKKNAPQYHSNVITVITLPSPHHSNYHFSVTHITVHSTFHTFPFPSLSVTLHTLFRFLDTHCREMAGEKAESYCTLY
jgi:effector-binding domain-containing protein